jgi:hypothetical protein
MGYGLTADICCSKWMGTFVPDHTSALGSFAALAWAGSTLQAPRLAWIRSLGVHSCDIYYIVSSFWRDTGLVGEPSGCMPLRE